MNFFILTVILSGVPTELALFPNQEACRVVAHALNTHPENPDPAAFVCILKTDV